MRQGRPARGTVPVHDGTGNEVRAEDREGEGELPAVVDVGERLVVVGTGFRIVKVCEPECRRPEPGHDRDGNRAAVAMFLRGRARSRSCSIQRWSRAAAFQ